jgi:hypothetical protein
VRVVFIEPLAWPEHMTTSGGVQSLFTVGTSAHDRRTGGSDQRIYIDDIPRRGALLDR